MVKYLFLPIRLIIVPVIILNLVSCGAAIGRFVISQPDEYTHVYEAKETVILRAIAGVFKEKNIGSKVTIDQKESSGRFGLCGFRVIGGQKPMLDVRQLNWKECEVILAVTTEKKTANRLGNTTPVRERTILQFF